MRRAVLALALLAQLPTARADDDVDVPGLDAPDLHGDALAWEDATFYLEPWEGGANVRFATFGRGRREEVGRAIPVRIVAATRTFVEIEPSPVLGCANRRLEADPRVEALRLYVKRDDLAPVLLKPYAITYTDGTGVRLTAGVPVQPTPSGLYIVSARGDKLHLSIPHASVGYVFTNVKVPEVERPTGAAVRVDRSAAVKLGGDPLEVRAGWLAPKPTKQAQAEQQLLRWSARCIDLTVSVPASSLRADTWTRPYRPYEAGFTAPRYPQHVLRGTPLATPSGREVAVAADAIDIELPAGASAACFDARLTMTRVEDPPQSSVVRTTKLCADKAHVVSGAPLPPPSPPPAATKASRTPLDIR